MISPEGKREDMHDKWPGVTKEYMEKVIGEGHAMLVAEIAVYGRVTKEKREIILDAIANSGNAQAAAFILNNAANLEEEEKEKLRSIVKTGE